MENTETLFQPLTDTEELQINGGLSKWAFVFSGGMLSFWGAFLNGYFNGRNA